MMQKSMDVKLQDIRANASSKEFIICYAADPDMGAGMAPLVGLYPSLRAYHESLAGLIEQAKLDIMLTSTSAMDVLAREWRVFDNSPVTPSIRANDASDIWSGRGFTYAKQPSRPFTTTTIEEAQYGTLLPKPGQQPDVNLGLYSLTFNNDLETDAFALERLKEFRLEAVRKGFRYFIEVFNPNAPVNLSPEAVPSFVNDCIARMLAGIPQASRPEFLKIPYNGPKATEELVKYTSVVVGILGGPASTTHDSYKLIAEVKKYGARVALFGRRIKDAADPLAFTEFLRAVVDGDLSPEEGVKAYHGALQRAGIKSKRSLEEDMVIETAALRNS